LISKFILRFVRSSHCCQSLEKKFKSFYNKKINGLFIEKSKHLNSRRTLESDLSRNAEKRRDKKKPQKSLKNMKNAKKKNIDCVNNRPKKKNKREKRRKVKNSKNSRKSMNES
jgi:alpha-glucosidase (family GH31 glycosyl hydrolase)